MLSLQPCLAAAGPRSKGILSAVLPPSGTKPYCCIISLLVLLQASTDNAHDLLLWQLC